MKDWRYFCIHPLAICVGVLGFGLATAHADPVDSKVLSYAVTVAPEVCHTFDRYPYRPAVVGVMWFIEDSGLTAEQARQVIVLSVLNECPRHTELLKTFRPAVHPSPTRRLV